MAYPTSTISCHYTNTLFNGTATPDFRYLVSSFGPYGYELDLTQLSDEKKAELNRYTGKYREIANFTLDCDLYRLIAPKDNRFCAYIQVTKDKKKALFTFIQFASCPLYSDFVVKLQGLDENTVYENMMTGRKLTGGAWMNVGLRIPRLLNERSGSGVQYVFRATQDK